ncbi:MAG: rhomboid family intramembrane serine protease [Acidimicrobiia bacterium]|nr:rhomboid family intramembrane serine protease [Acidimicrobiia bacterium]
MSTETGTTCYRHPDRTTRLACSECGRPICVECSNDAAVGQKCPECSKPQGRARVIDARRSVTRSSATPLVLGLIAVNVGIFLLGLASTELDRELFLGGAQFNETVRVSRTDIVLGIAGGEWWRALSAMFLHGSITHVLFNMWALWLFGPVLERRFGTAAFATLYVASGLSGSAAYYLLGGPIPAVGASGAIFGLFGALLAASFRQRHTVAGRAVFSQLGLLLAINLALPLFVPNIAWQAHMGGLVAGAAIAFGWDRLPLRGSGVAGARVGVAAAVAVVALGVVMFL